MGYISLSTVTLMSPPRKSIWTIRSVGISEQYFNYLKNSVSSSASLAHTDEYFCGLAFLNYISPLYYYDLQNVLRIISLDEKYSAEDVLNLTKNIYRVYTGDGQEYKVSAIHKKIQALLGTIGVNLLRKN